MAKVTFQCDVRGYMAGDDGRIWLTVDESEPSPTAQMHVHDLTRNFNPSSGKAGFGSRDVPCSIKPGFASYRVPLAKEEAERMGVTLGSVVELTLDVYFVRNVLFVAGRNGKAGRWAAIPEMKYDILGLKPAQTTQPPRTGGNASTAPQETSPAPSTGGNSGSGRNK